MRRAEIESDIFEQLVTTRCSSRRTGAAIAGRTLRGVAGDVAWRREERAMDHAKASALASGPARHLRWFALIPLVPAAPFLFFGLLWRAPVQVSVGVGLVFGAIVIWRVFSGAWPLESVRRRA
jgi:hypothetical protein